MDGFLVDDQVRKTIQKNAATSYGLTLVAGLPLPYLICDRIGHVQAQIEGLLPDRFTWYSRDQLHTTVIAPLLGRYRESPPLRRDELPADLDGFVEAVSRCFDNQLPFTVTFAKTLLTSHGLLIAAGSDEAHVRQWVAQCLKPFPELDAPKNLEEWHITLGYLHTPTPFDTAHEQTRFAAALAGLHDYLPCSIEIDQVWLVHYSNRTLNRILGKTPFVLGQTHARTAEAVINDLGVVGW